MGVVGGCNGGGGGGSGGVRKKEKQSSVNECYANEFKKPMNMQST